MEGARGERTFGAPLPDMVRRPVARPTCGLVQARCIPLALHGEEVAVRARMGSGKTIAFSLSLLRKILLSKDGGVGGEAADATAKIHCLIVTPWHISRGTSHGSSAYKHYSDLS